MENASCFELCEKQSLKKLMSQFDWKFYTMHYGLSELLPTEHRAKKHFMKFGFNEGRICCKSMLPLKKALPLPLPWPLPLNNVLPLPLPLPLLSNNDVLLSNNAVIEQQQQQQPDTLNDAATKAAFDITDIPNISIVMAYFNRKDIILKTLDVFEKRYAGKHKFEVIIVDDDSNCEHKLHTDITKYSFPIRLIVIDALEKGARLNSCSVFNKGFLKVRGTKVMIQNPECIHLGDLLEYVERTFEYDKYISFPCYNSNNNRVNAFLFEHIGDNDNSITINNVEEKTKSFNQDDTIPGFPIWYQHPTISDKNLHFCCVVDAEYLKILGGFNEEYRDGVCFEDDEFIYKIKHILKLEVVSVKLSENVGVVHLYHGRSAGVNISPSITNVKQNARYEQYCLNQNLFEYQQRINKPISCPKIFHYYWDNFEKFSYMNLYSLRSAVHYHPDYIHVIWCPTDPQHNITWNEICNKEFTSDPDWQIYVEEMKKMPNVRIIYKDMCTFLNVDHEMSEIHKSDLFRYKIIHMYGGIWSDLDIVYIKPVTDVVSFEFDTVNFLCKIADVFYVPIGLLFSKRKSWLFAKIVNLAMDNYCKHRYQCLGSELFVNLFFNLTGKNNSFEMSKCSSVDTVDNKIHMHHSNFTYTTTGILELFSSSGCHNVILDEMTYMIYNWTEIDKLFVNNNTKTPDKNLSETIGFHWFNGSDIAKNKISKIVKGKIPNTFNGVLFCEKHKLSTISRIDNIEHMSHFKINGISDWATFYFNKMDVFLSLFAPASKIKTIGIDDYCTRFDLTIFESFDNHDQMFVFDELLYAHFLCCFEFGNDKFKKDLKKVLATIQYVCLFCELFENEQLQTIGNKFCNIDFAQFFFKHAKQVYVCNTRNINYLLKKDIHQNVVYFPPIGQICSTPLKRADQTKFDIVVYGNALPEFSHRNVAIVHLLEFCSKQEYRMTLRRDLFDDEKDTILSQCNMVIHIPSHSNLHAFPWAKCSELMHKKVFFIVEENEELYVKGLDKMVVFYKKNDLEDLTNKIGFYMKNAAEREHHVYKCFHFMDALFKSASPFVGLRDKVSTRSMLSNVSVCATQNEQFVDKKKRHIELKYFDYGYSVYFEFYKNKTSQIVNIIKHSHESCTVCDMKIEYLAFGCIKSKTEKTINSIVHTVQCAMKEATEQTIFIFDELDYANLMELFNYNTDVQNTITHFLKLHIYHVFFCEIFEDADTLKTIGNNHFNKTFAHMYFLNAAKIFVCDTKNSDFLLKTGISTNQIVYLPSSCYSPINNICPHIAPCDQEVDILFYGNICRDAIPRRSNLIEFVQEVSNKHGLHFCCKTGFFGEEKNIMLRKTKIVIHLPSFENLRTFPWAKAGELMAKKVFFIVEENDEMYLKGLDKLVVFYKKNDKHDLTEKILYYINNVQEREKIVEGCFEFITFNFDMDKIVRDQIL